MSLAKQTYIKTKTTYCIPRYLIGGPYRHQETGQAYQLRGDSLGVVLEQLYGLFARYYSNINNSCNYLSAPQQVQHFQFNAAAYEFVPGAHVAGCSRPISTPVGLHQPAVPDASKPLWSTIVSGARAS